ncbi:hypothetical protein GM527_14115 [Streptococcus pneumoniae]|nr:hypothetical protein [Streptococcus pneumoniae]
MFIEYRQGYGYVLYGMGERLAEFEIECLKAIAHDAADVSFADQQDAYAARIIKPRATPSNMIGYSG